MTSNSLLTHARLISSANPGPMPCPAITGEIPLTAVVESLADLAQSGLQGASHDAQQQLSEILRLASEMKAAAA